MADSSPDLLVIAESAARAGPPNVLLRFLEWLSSNTSVGFSVVVLRGGGLTHEFRPFNAHVIGSGQDRFSILVRGLKSMDFERFANGLSAARIRPAFWVRRDAPLVLFNSVGSLPAIDYLPGRSSAKVVLYVHEMDDAFDRAIEPDTWKRLSPQVDHYLTRGAQVTEMLVERKGVPAERVTTQPGMVGSNKVEQLRGRYRRREMNIPAEAIVVGASGIPDWQRGPEVFVRVARTLSRRRPDLNLHFVWLGGWPAHSDTWKLLHDVQGAGLADRFHHLPETDHPEEVLNIFDVFALTSREDSFSLTMLEAASLGIPVVSFANRCAVELADAGGSDPLIPVVPYLDVGAMAEAILGYVENPTRRHNAGQRLQQHVLSTHSTEVAAPLMFDTLATLAPSLRAKRHTWTSLETS